MQKDIENWLPLLFLLWHRDEKVAKQKEKITSRDWLLQVFKMVKWWNSLKKNDEENDLHKLMGSDADEKDLDSEDKNVCQVLIRE